MNTNDYKFISKLDDLKSDYWDESLVDVGKFTFMKTSDLDSDGTPDFNDNGRLIDVTIYYRNNEIGRIHKNGFKGEYICQINTPVYYNPNKIVFEGPLYSFKFNDAQDFFDELIDFINDEMIDRFDDDEYDNNNRTVNIDDLNKDDYNKVMNRRNESIKRKSVRLSESELHRVIKNTVKRVINESDLKFRPFDHYRNWKKENPDKDMNDWWDDIRDTPEMQNEIGWSKLQSYPDYDTSDDENLNIKERPNQRRWNKEWDKDMDSYYEDQDEPNPIRKDFDNRWESSKQLDKDASVASKRKLHRAGSMNRDIPESLIRKSIRESFKKMIK